MFSNGLLVIGLPCAKFFPHIGNYLKQIKNTINGVVYIKLEKNVNFNQLSCASLLEEEYLNLIPNIHHIANLNSPFLDVRVLINNNSLMHKPQVIFTNLNSTCDKFWKNYLKVNFNLEIIKDIRQFKKISEEETNETLINSVCLKKYDYTCLGGTFDNLHNGHKVFLSQALISTQKAITIGVTDLEMVKHKLLFELILPIYERIKLLKEYLLDVNNSLDYNIVPISDPFGPAIEDEKLQLLIVSEETIKNGEKINEIRLSKKMKTMDIFVVNLIKENHKLFPIEEEKISSSSFRIRKLGTLLKEPKCKPNLPNKPYLIGITGGIASGKTNICDKLSSLGAAIINCDKLAHESYMTPNSIAYNSIVQAFSKDVVNTSDLNIDRKKLGAVVFNDPQKLRLLNSIVWPATSQLVKKNLDQIKNNYEVIVLEVALLLEANWDEKVHQVWVSIIPESEAIKRLKKRNNLNENEAKKRILSQMSNFERVKRANVVFCSLWDKEFTQLQVEKAWNILVNNYLNKS